MTAPLMMIGPGGDYVTRFDVKGDGLVKTRTQHTAGQNQDGGGNSVVWGLIPRRRKSKKAPFKAAQPAGRADQFEHTASPALPAAYAKPSVADLQQQLAMLQAIEHWLAGQQDELNRLAAIQTATEAGLTQAVPEAGAEARAAAGSASITNTPGSSPAPVRVIRFNRTTMAMPTPAPSLVPDFAPEPCHAFATDEQALTEQPDNPTQLERSVLDDQPEPHAQADENFNAHSRHPAIARLFADDERARRSLRRLKGHGLRARRSAHQKGLPDQGCEQGALFGVVA